MVDVIAIALVLGGTVLLFSGAALSVYGVALLGAVIGGSGGYLVAPTIGGLIGLEGLVAVVAATAVGAVAGVVVTYSLLSIAIAAVSVIVGTFVGVVAIAPALVDGPALLVYLAAFAVGLLAAFLGLIMTKTMMILITSFVGASLVSRSLTVQDFAAAQAAFTLDPLIFDLAAPFLLGLFALGVLAQFGLFKFGYVLKIVSLLPGASVFRDRQKKTGN